VRQAPDGVPSLVAASVAERHRALLRRSRIRPNSTLASQAAPLLEAEQLGVESDHVGTARADAARRQHRQQLGEHRRRRQVAERLDIAGIPGRLQAQEARPRRFEHFGTVEPGRMKAGRARRARGDERRCRGMHVTLRAGVAVAPALRPKAPGRAGENDRGKAGQRHGPRDFDRMARREQRPERGEHADPRRQAAEDEPARAGGGRGRAAEEERQAEAERHRCAQAPRQPHARSRRRGAQHLIPTCRATTPALRLWTST
jgi:hypothetical protein